MKKLLVRILKPGKVSIINKLIERYELVIQELEENPHMGLYEFECIILRNRVHVGVCRCANAVFGETIQGKRWVTRNCRSGKYWAETPVEKLSERKYPKEKALAMLKIRVDILKSELLRL